MKRLCPRATRWHAALAMLLLAATPSAAQAQVKWQDLVLTMGGSFESYSGNFSAASVAIVDSTNHANGVVADVGARGVLSLLSDGGRDLAISFDGGLRQTAAMGFRNRDYAPREWVGNFSARFGQRLGTWGSLTARGAARGRSVRDRPPMPLFLQPSYGNLQGSLALVTRSFDGVSLDATVDIESADYRAPKLLPQLDLLDRSSSGAEVGLRCGGPSTVRFYGGVRWADYENQPSGDPTDPYRRDRTARVGVEWTYVGTIFAQAGLDGTLNRSNSNRPEYDALSFRALVTAPLPADMSLTLYAVLTGKSYVSDTGFARLVPGEEADNASIAYLQVGRALAVNLDGAVRFGWSRAETDIGSAYYRRFGGSVQFNYRPLGN